MDLAEFRKYQLNISESVIRLDDLNPFELIEKISLDGNTISSKDWICKFFSNKDLEITEGFGVRHLMELCFIELKEKLDTVIIPEDVYPFYLDLAKRYFKNIIFYSSYPELNFNNVSYGNSVLIFTNPLTPVGRFANSLEISFLDKWLEADKSRYLIIDSCYNFSKSFVIESFNSDRAIELLSVSKLFLKRKEKGWMISKNKELKISTIPKEIQLVEDFPGILESLFKKVWKDISPKLKGISLDWEIPEISYLSIINVDYKTLLEYNIAAVPASVFGSKQENMSVLSVLSILKNELHRQ